MIREIRVLTANNAVVTYRLSSSIDNDDSMMEVAGYAANSQMSLAKVRDELQAEVNPPVGRSS